MAEFNQEQAIKDYTELFRLIRVGAYEERSAEHYDTGTWPEDGVEESIFNLDLLAAQNSLQFIWHKDSNTFTLEPISAEDLEAFIQVAVGDIYVLEVRAGFFTIHRYDGQNWEQLAHFAAMLTVRCRNA